MNLVEIKANVDVNQPEQVAALNSFLSALGGTVTATFDTEKPLKVEKKIKGAKSIQKQEAVETEAPGEISPNEVEVKEPQEVKEPAKEPAKEESSIKVEDVRALLPLLGNDADKKQKAKDKLTEFGAQNVSTLDPKHYQAMHDFLKELTNG